VSTQFRPIEIPPGVVAMATKQMRSSNWAEVNLVRWREGMLSPVGGQAQYTYAFASRCKAIHSWYDLNNVFYIAYLCEANLYVDVGGLLYDVTPGDGIIPPVPLTEGGYGEGPYSAGTYGTPRPESTVNALNKVPDAFSLDNFGAILYAMTSPDGRLLRWDPSNGPPGFIFGIGASAAWDTTATVITMVSPSGGQAAPGMAVYNNTANTLVGAVLTYTGNTLTLAAPALNAGSVGDMLHFGNVATPQLADSGRGTVPSGRSFVITQERFVMVFGAYDNTYGGGPRRFAWCDQENPGAWDYANITSQAGYLDIEPAAPIIAAVAGPMGVLMWTATRTYLNAFLGLPYIYNYTEIAKNCTPWSPQSIVPTTSLTLWMSEQGMFSYNGAWVQPVPCKVRPWVDDDIDILNVREQACAVHVSPFSEFWWFFPQGVANNPAGTNTRCIIYNYKEGWWSQGQMSRSAGVAASYTVQTIMADGLNAYQHEIGIVYPANVPLPWAETFDLNLTSGSRLVTVKQLIPDVGGDVTNLRYSLFYKNSRSVMPDPNGAPIPVVEAQTAPRTVNTSNGFVDLRTTGRDIRMRISLAGPQVNPVTVGQHLIDVAVRGDR
jgi:hypothetical protein